MTEGLKIIGEYKIEKVDKQGNKEVIFKGHNKLTDFFKSYLMSNFSQIFNGAYYPKGATDCELLGMSGLSEQEYGSDRVTYFVNSLCLYGLNEEYNVEEYNNYPFLTGIREVDESKITFIGSDNDTGDKFAVVIPTEYLNMLVPNTISKSWKLTGPNGLGEIKTLCIGTNVHTPLTSSIISGTYATTQENTPPFISKILSANCIDDNNNFQLTNGYLPPISDFTGNKFYFGVESYNNKGNVYNSYNINTDTFKQISSTDEERNYPLASLNSNVIKYNDDIYFGKSYSSSSYNLYKYNITTKTLTRLNNSNFGSNTCNVFKKGNIAILNKIYSKRSDSNLANIYLLNMDTNTLDTTLFGSYNPKKVDIVQGIPSWFTVTDIGTRNDNENWLILDRYKGICVECTDISNVEESFVKMYYTYTLNHTIINNKIYWLSQERYTEKRLYLIGTMTGTGTLNSNPIQITDSDIPSNMFSIISGIKDSSNNDIVQTEESEYIFTYTLKFN